MNGEERAKYREELMARSRGWMERKRFKGIPPEKVAELKRRQYGDQKDGQ